MKFLRKYFSMAIIYGNRVGALNVLKYKKFVVLVSDRLMLVYIRTMIEIYGIRSMQLRNLIVTY